MIIHIGSMCGIFTYIHLAQEFMVLNIGKYTSPTDPTWVLLLPCCLGGGFKYFLCSSLVGEDEPILTHIFQRGWFNHQPVVLVSKNVVWMAGAGEAASANLDAEASSESGASRSWSVGFASYKKWVEKVTRLHQGIIKLPSRELAYPPKMAFWRWFSFSPGGIC